ncbi:MAG: hypothetical protein UHN02_05740 [Acutalibacteraceae bacterium]|nr:hypothetical protein [Acutalibacteraceae bacterium]
MKVSIKDLAVFSMLGALMYISKFLMEFLPNIHLIGVFTIAITVVYRLKALYPIYIFVLITGLLNGFATWWIPYLYIWTVLWAVTMLIPDKKLNKKIRPVIYMVICALHGLLYGTLYAPAQALLFGLDFKGMIAWIIAGFSYDVVHAVGNFFGGILICPIISVLKSAQRYAKPN